MKKLLGVSLVISFIIMMCSGCSQKTCPTYDSAIRAKGHRYVSKYEKRNANFCEPTKKQIKSFAF